MPPQISAELFESVKDMSKGAFRLAVGLEFSSWERNNDGEWSVISLASEAKRHDCGSTEIEGLISLGWLIHPHGERVKISRYLDRNHSAATRDNLRASRAAAATSRKSTPLARVGSNLVKPKPVKPKPVSTPRQRDTAFDAVAKFHGLQEGMPIPKELGGRIAKATQALKAAGIVDDANLEALAAAYVRKYPNLAHPSIEALAKHCLPLIKEYQQSGTIRSSSPVSAHEHNMSTAQRVRDRITANNAELECL